MASARKKKNGGSAEGGFTLVEAVLSMTILSLVAAALFGVYASGLQAMEETILRSQIEAAARSRMEKILAYKFSKLGSGEETVVIDGESYTVRWWASWVDLDGDYYGEYEARQILVQCEDVYFSTIVFKGKPYRIKI